jgi:hypothetical protein
MAGNEKQEALFVQGNPVVVLLDGRLQLEPGALSDAHRKTLGENKLKSLQAAGYLKTQEQLDEAEEARVRLADAQPDPHAINPNFGTPSMTPEAEAKHDKPAEAKAPTAAAPHGHNVPAATPSAISARPITDLDVSEATAAALKGHGFKTVGDVLDFGAAHGKLAGQVDGIGEARETEVQEAIVKLNKGK